MAVSEFLQENYVKISGINKNHWLEFSLLCEQEVVNVASGWNVEGDVINMTDYVRQNYDF